MKRLAVLLLLAALLVTGCGHSITSGTVIDKRYVPARDWETTEPTIMYIPVTNYRTVCSTVNKQTQCRSQAYTDMQMRIVGYHQERHHENEYWVLTLRDSESDDTGDVRVSKERFNSISIGSTYNTEQG